MPRIQLSRGESFEYNGCIFKCSRLHCANIVGVDTSEIVPMGEVTMTPAKRIVILPNNCDRRVDTPTGELGFRKIVCVLAGQTESPSQLVET